MEDIQCRQEEGKTQTRIYLALGLAGCDRSRGPRAYPRAENRLELRGPGRQQLLMASG